MAGKTKRRSLNVRTPKKAKYTSLRPSNKNKRKRKRKGTKLKDTKRALGNGVTKKQLIDFIKSNEVNYSNLRSEYACITNESNSNYNYMQEQIDTIIRRSGSTSNTPYDLEKMVLASVPDDCVSPRASTGPPPSEDWVPNLMLRIGSQH
jgi:hypothetical protein